jgi:hypothetical protein
VLLGFVSGRSSAEPGLASGGEVTREVSLLKASPGDLRFRWSAAVHEAGGEFIISRQALGGTASEVMHVRPRGDGRYQVAEHGHAGSWVYWLRYRDRRGHDHILARVWLNVDRLDAGRGILTSDAYGGPPAIRTAAVLPTPGAVALSRSHWVEAADGDRDPRPPTPPP